MTGVLVYGGEVGGCAAAMAAARRLPDGAAVVLAYPESRPGGMATAGRLSAWERRPWTHGGRRADPQGGAFGRWVERFGAVFDPERFAQALEDDLHEAGVRLMPGTDIAEVRPERPPRGSRPRRPRRGPPAALAAVRLRGLGDGPGAPAWAEADAEEIAADMFIDASATGRLARLAGVPQSVGRADWGPDSLQMAAGLPCAVHGVDWDALPAARDDDDRPVWGVADDGPSARRFWGGRHVAANDPLIAEFARAHPGFRFAAPSAWEGRDGAFWVDALRVYGVDARRRAYDEGAESDVPSEPPPGTDVDQAWKRAAALCASPDFLACLRRFPGLEKARVVEGEGATGAVLFLREGAHTVAPGPDAFAVRVADVTGAGTGGGDGLDQRCFPRRVGLGFYWMENAGYSPDEALPATAAGANPVYLPVDAFLAPPVANLLVPGYAARIDSRAWWALRTLPTLSVLGEAAGVAAAEAAREGVPPLHFGNSEMAAVHARLVEDGAILDKW